MLETSIQLRERFCKDCNIPLKLYQSPYFEERLELYDPFYGTVKKWDIFLKEIEKYKNEQDYFEDYNRIKEAAITSIKNTVAYQKFLSEDITDKFFIKNLDFPSQDIFKASNDSKTFISIDMRKANFSALRYYYPEMFVGKSGTAKSWEEFIGMFTDNEHIINSKYIRQVILGNCNPKRQVAIEKYIMRNILSYVLNLIEPEIKKESVVFFSNDEIVLDVTENGYSGYVKTVIFNGLSQFSDPFPLFKIESFILHSIPGTDGYYKEIHSENGEITYKFKCLNSYMLPFVIRKFRGEEVKESDKVFYHNGALAKYIEVPQIEIK